MVEKIRHQLFLPKPISDRLEALAAKPGASKSAILTDAVTAWLNRRGASELEDRFGIRLDRLTAAIGRLERDGHIQLETLALFRQMGELDKEFGDAWKLAAAEAGAEVPVDERSREEPKEVRP